MTNGKLSHILSVSWIYDLYRLGHAAFGDNSGEIYQKILEHIVKGFSATSGSLALRGDPGTDELTIVAGIDLPKRAMGAKVKFGEGVLGKVAQEGTPLLLNGDVSRDTRFKNKQAREETRTPLSAMCWPLKVDEAIIGVLSINNNTGIEFQTEQLQQGSVITNLVSVVIENANLHSAQKSLIHQLQEAQAQLLQSEKMASVGQLAAGIAHEINNPVNAIVNTVGPLEEVVANIDKDPEAAKEAVEMVKVVQRGAQRTKAIVAALHNYSRTDDESIVDFDIDRSIDDSLELLRHLLKQNVTVEKKYKNPGRVRGHAGQINQVFMNLLTNAAQALAGRENATVTIETGGDADGVEVKIIDNGPGIPPEVLPRIWDPFFTTKDVGEGTGLGLSIVHELVERHGGTIDCHTKIGEGTTFTVKLPRKIQSNDRASDPSPQVRSTLTG